MAISTIHWQSLTVGKQVAMNVLLPVGGKGPFPVYYLLHGLTDDFSVWMRQTRIEAFASAYPLVVVMPDGGRSYFSNMEKGPAYGDFIAQELPDFVERNFNVRKDRGGRCIGGISMGGFGAIRAALANPDRYVSANSHSGALNVTRRKAQQQIPEYTQIFGAVPTESPSDSVALAGKVSAESVPQMRLDCGTDDHLLNESRFFHGELNRLGIAHEYEEFPGGHGWDYWNVHVVEVLAFHAKHLGIAKL